MASLMVTSGLASTLPLPPPDPPPLAFSSDLSTVVSSPDPPDPPDPPDNLVGFSSISLSILLTLSDLNSKIVQAFTSLDLGVVSFSLVPSGGTFIASLRSITAVCSSWYQTVDCLKFPQYEAVLILVKLRLPLPHYVVDMSSIKLRIEAAMISIMLMLPLPQYEAFIRSIKLRIEAAMISIMLMLPLPQYEAFIRSIKFPLPQYEAVMSSIKFRTILPQYEEVIHKLIPSSIHDIVLLVGFYENSRWFLKKTIDVLTKNNLGSWILDLFIEKWWYSQVHISPKLRFSSHLVGSASWCIVAYAFVAVFQVAVFSLVDAASLGIRSSPSVLSDFQSLISLPSTIGISNFSCLRVMCASICFLQFYRIAFVATVSLAYVAFLLYLLNIFSIIRE